MGHAQRKEESVHSRTLLPPPLPTRSGIAPKAAPTHSVPPPPPPPPLAALHSAPAPKSPLPASDLKLAILPLWADAAAPLLPAKKNRIGLGFWIGSTAVSLIAGALVAAGIMGARLPQHTSQPTAPQPAAVADEAVEQVAAPAQLTAAKAAPDMEIGTEEAFAHERAVTLPTTVLVPQVTVTAAKQVKQVKRGKVSVRANAKVRGAGPKAASVVSTSWQPDPAVEAEAKSSASEAAATSEAPATSEAAPAPAPEPEPVAAPEPPKPVLPEQLTREQVRQGMESKRGAVIKCAKGAYGKVLADVTIAPSGKVSSSLIDGTFAGTSVGSCMSSALRGAQFPAFSGPEIQVRYPFSF